MDWDGNVVRDDRLAQEIIGNFYTGIASYPRGIYRGLRSDARALGLFGKCEQARSRAEGLVFDALLNIINKNPELALDLSQEYASNNKTLLAGRSTPGTLVSSRIGIGGIAISGYAAYGDLRYSLEQGVSSLEEAIEAILGGEVTILSSDGYGCYCE